MKEERKPYFGFPQENSQDQIVDGLNEATKATKQKIRDYKAKNWDASELETHLEKLEKELESFGR